MRPLPDPGANNYGLRGNGRLLRDSTILSITNQKRPRVREHPRGAVCPGPLPPRPAGELPECTRAPALASSHL
ncbi:hypothetical protein ACWC5I_01405 [Kitasatospora sp. NPDC001574]